MYGGRAGHGGGVLPLIGAALALSLPGSAPAGERAPSAFVAQGVATAPADPDSSELLADLRRAQRGFERRRERHMRRVPAGFGRCDEIIGRFCLWHDPEANWEPPPEDPELAEARQALLERLERAAAALPRDGWIAGQRVRYLQEAGRHGDALRAARECRAGAPGWCAALAGYALHGAGDFRRADSAFALALEAMPAAERCRWANLEPLLDGRGRKAYRKLPCGKRGRFEARFWWLADPLYLVPGNERRTEHLWRRVMDRMQAEAASGYGVSWGDDLREILIRYGWPAGWERSRHRPGALAGGGPTTVAHDPPGIRHFVPRGRWIEEPTGIPPGEWELETRRPRSHYAPGYAREFDDLEPELARFRRGGAAVVVAAVAAGESTPTGCDGIEAGLFLAAGPEGPDGEDRVRAAAGATSLMAVLSPAAPAALASVEIACPPERWAARARFGVELPSAEPGISDLLLGRAVAGGAPPTTLEEAAAGARAGRELRPGERVPLYWEVYGARGTEATSVTVDLVRRGGGLFRKLARWTGLAGERRPLAGLRWEDRTPDPGVWARSVTLEIPEDVPAGRYELRVTVALDGGLPLRAARLVQVVEGDGT